MKLKYFTTEHQPTKIPRKVYKTDKGNIVLVGKNYKDHYYIDVFKDLGDYYYDSPLAKFHDETLSCARDILKRDF